MADTNIATTGVHANLQSLRKLHRAMVLTSETTGYAFWSSDAQDLVYSKTTDSGATWSAPVTVSNSADSDMRFSIWYDRWTDASDAGTTIHCAYVYNVSGTKEIRYRSLQTTTDTLGSERTVATWTTFDGSVDLSIVKSRSDRFFIYYTLGTSTVAFYTSTDSISWSSRSVPFSGNFLGMLLPGNESDADDVWMLFYDHTNKNLKLGVYDHSANSWSNSTIVNLPSQNNTGSEVFAAAPRHSDNGAVVAVWNEHDAATADLLFYSITNGTTFVAKTNVETNLNDAACAHVHLNQNNGDTYVAYFKPGSGTWQDQVDVYYRKTDDGGTTWGASTRYSESDDDFRLIYGDISTRTGTAGRFMPMAFNHDLADLIVNEGNSVELEAAGGGGGGTLGAALLLLTN